MPSSKDPEIKLLHTKINDRTLDHRIGYKQVLELVPELAARFHSDSNYKANFPNYWGNIKRRYLAQGLLFGSSRKEGAEPIAPDPGDHPPTFSPDCWTPRSTAESPSSFEDSPPMFGTPMMHGSPTPPPALTPPRHRGGASKAASASAPGSPSVEDLSRRMSRSNLIVVDEEKLVVHRVPFEDDLRNKYAMFLVQVPSGAAIFEASVSKGGSSVKLDWSKPEALMNPQLLRAEIDRALADPNQNVTQKMIKITNRMFRSFEKDINNGGTGPRMVSHFRMSPSSFYSFLLF